MLMFSDGKVAKFRASCDSCNETKVRCSQTKPQCGRCAKQGIACIYGLSRRSHKTAPRVGASGADIGSTAESPPLLYQQQPQQLLPTPESTHDSSSSSTVATAYTTPLLPTVPYNNVGRQSCTAEPVADFTLSDWPLIESSLFGLDTDLELPPNLPLDSLKARSGSFGAPLQTHSLGSSRSDSPLSLNNLVDKSDNHVPETCNCRTLAVKQLQCLSVPPDSCGSNEVYFTHLKRAIAVAEICLGCRCIAQDDTCMLIIGTLISNMIERLDYLMTQASQPARPHYRSNSTDAPNDASSSRPSSRLWGSLEIEPQEEAELKFHLYLIQLRKLRGILNKMMASVDLVSASEGRGNSAKAMTIQYICVWLMRKVKALNANLPTVT